MTGIVESYWVRFSVKSRFIGGVSHSYSVLVRSPIKVGNREQYDKLIRVIRSQLHGSSVLDIKQLSWLGTFFQEEGEVLNEIWYE